MKNYDMKISSTSCPWACHGTSSDPECCCLYCRRCAPILKYALFDNLTDSTEAIGIVTHLRHFKVLAVDLWCFDKMTGSFVTGHIVFQVIPVETLQSICIHSLWKSPIVTIVHTAGHVMIDLIYSGQVDIEVVRHKQSLLISCHSTIKCMSTRHTMHHKLHIQMVKTYIVLIGGWHCSLIRHCTCGYESIQSSWCTVNHAWACSMTSGQNKLLLSLHETTTYCMVEVLNQDCCPCIGSHPDNWEL